MESHEKFRDKFKIKFDLVADVKKEAIKAYKVWGKKKILGQRIYGSNKKHIFIKR